MHRFVFFIVVSLLFIFSPSALKSQSKDDCLTCHNDQSLNGKRNGKTISLYVSPKVFQNSIHGNAECIDCHTDLKGKEMPHESPLKPVECGTCHQDIKALHDQSLHGKAIARGDKLAPHCTDCHGNHNIKSVKDPNSEVAPLRIPFVCGKCHTEGTPVTKQRVIHQDLVLQNYSESIHGEGLFKKGLSVSATCASCHTSHFILPHTDPRSSISKQNISATCAKCHAQIEQVHKKVIKGELWEKQAHILPACVDCHQPHKVRRVYYDAGMADKNCMRCHSDKSLKSKKDGRTLFVDVRELAQSKHATKIACSQCHSEVSFSLSRPCMTITKKVDCGSCHTGVMNDYQASTHGKLHAKNDPNAPHCTDCHGKHNVRGKNEPMSPIFSSSIPALCARCHRSGQKAALRYTGTETQVIEHYIESIHGKGLLKSGLLVTAKCTDCHTSHRELPAADTSSSINPKNIIATCGKCHHGIEEKFVGSIHSKAISTSSKKLPVCNTCHSAHTIRRADEKGFQLEIMTTCGHCHEDIAKTYFDTYHGKVSQLGYTKTAKCYDCHGSHDVLPTTDPRSHLSHANIVETCKNCHPSATRQFAGYLTHATHHEPTKYPILFITFWAMTILLLTTFFLSGLHTLLWLPRTWGLRKSYKQMKHEPNGKYFRRFTQLQRTLHILMVVSFISLALTGMTLKFAYTGWAVFLSKIFGGFEQAGIFHRIAAVLMVGLFVTHIVDLFRKKTHKYKSWKELLFGPNTMIFTKRDLVEFSDSIKWFLGAGPRPQYGRWTYWEKFDYLAVFWGVFIIGSTGLTLWFPEFFTIFVPGWFLNVATIVHSDEALLAAGFIFTIHFFNTHWRPEKFPMDIVIFTGRMPLEEFKRDKPREYEELLAAGELDQHLVDPPNPLLVRFVRIFGWTALTLGLSTVVLIIYAMLFVYR
jgi:cytochrome b subunit of formate dehydrogenase